MCACANGAPLCFLSVTTCFHLDAVSTWHAALTFRKVIHVFCRNSRKPVLFSLRAAQVHSLPWRAIAVAWLAACRQTATFTRSRCRTTPPTAAPSSQMWPCCRRSSLSSSPSMCWLWRWVCLGTTCSSTSSAEPARCTTSPTSSLGTWPSLTCSCAWPACPLPSPTPSTHAAGCLAAPCATWCSSSSRSQSTCQCSHSLPSLLTGGWIFLCRGNQSWSDI